MSLSSSTASSDSGDHSSSPSAADADLPDHLDDEEWIEDADYSRPHYLSARQRKQLRRQRRKAVLALRQKAKKEREEKFIQEIMTCEPELDAMDPELVCPVCLDMLYEPFRALPCKHIFCETCLRRLGSKNAMDTNCPMCRQRIAYCETQPELNARIKSGHPEMAERRRKFEKSSNPSVFNMPLPWTPGWRNLFYGRPMGGNAFETRSYAELLRRVVQQLPYYIPPVLLANLINLVFFVFLLFAVEVVPTLLGLLMKRRPSERSLQNTLLQATNKLVSVDESLTVGEVSSDGTTHSGIGDTASGDMLHDYDDDASQGGGATAAAAASYLDAMAKAEEARQARGSLFFGPDPTTGGGAYPPSPEGSVMDTTFYYALYLVLFVGTLVGNFFLLNHPTSLIPRGSVFERWVHHPRWGTFNRRLLDVLLVLLLTTIPIVTLPLLISAGTDGVVAADAADATVNGDAAAAGGAISRSIVDSWVARLVESCTTVMPISYFLAAMAIVWVVSIYLDCQDDGGVLF